jgi:hypothetical protein
MIQVLKQWPESGRVSKDGLALTLTMPQSEEVNLPESIEDVKGDNHLPDQVKGEPEDQPVDKSLQRHSTKFNEP